MIQTALWFWVPINKTITRKRAAAFCNYECNYKSEMLTGQVITVLKSVSILLFLVWFRWHPLAVPFMARERRCCTSRVPTGHLLPSMFPVLNKHRRSDVIFSLVAPLIQRDFLSDTWNCGCDVRFPSQVTSDPDGLNNVQNVNSTRKRQIPE